MDAGNWIAILAAVVATWQAYAARKARKATTEQATTATDALEQSKKQSAAAEKSATSAMLSLGTAERAAGAAEDQVVLARQAVRAAEDQVVEARKAVKAAETQVEIAQRAAEAAERSAQADEHAAALAVRQAHEAKAPRFVLSHHKGTAPRTEIKVIMTEGASLSTVTIGLKGRNADLVHGFSIKGAEDQPTPVLEFGATRKGDTYDVIVHSKEVSGPTTIAIDVHCVPEDENVEPWTVAETFELNRPMRVWVG